MADRRQKLGKEAALILYELYTLGVTELSIDVEDDKQLLVTILPINAVTATLKEDQE